MFIIIVRRHPTPGDEDEAQVEWHVPGSLKYFGEDAPGPGGSAASARLALVEGFDERLWLGGAAGADGGPAREALGMYARLRLVREGGPEGLQLLSSPSPPMLLRMPPLAFAPTATPWFESGRQRAVLWWPCHAATAGAEDKNLSMATHVHQVRMRRPRCGRGGGWLSAPVRHTPRPF